MKKLAAIGVAVGLIVGLAGCSKPDNLTRTGTDAGWAVAQSVKLPGGGFVTCVILSSAVSCDWANAKHGE